MSGRAGRGASPSWSRNISATPISSPRSKACSSPPRPGSISAFSPALSRSAPAPAAPSTSSPRTWTSPSRWPARSARRERSGRWPPTSTSGRRPRAGAARGFQSSPGYWRQWPGWSCAMSDQDERVARLLLAQDVAEFLYREAEILDERRYEEWLALLADDIRYWMPMRRNVKFGEGERE